MIQQFRLGKDFAGKDGATYGELRSRNRKRTAKTCASCGVRVVSKCQPLRVTPLFGRYLGSVVLMAKHSESAVLSRPEISVPCPTGTLAYVRRLAVPHIHVLCPISTEVFVIVDHRFHFLRNEDTDLRPPDKNELWSSIL